MKNKNWKPESHWRMIHHEQANAKLWQYTLHHKSASLQPATFWIRRILFFLSQLIGGQRPALSAINLFPLGTITIANCNMTGVRNTFNEWNFLSRSQSIWIKKTDCVIFNVVQDRNKEYRRIYAKSKFISRYKKVTSY